VLNARVGEHHSDEDRPYADAAPKGDPLAGVKRSLQASFDWRGFLPLLPFFEGFDAHETDELASLGKVLELKRGDWAFVAGARASACYLVLRGALEIFTRNGETQRRVAIAGPGELVGFMAVINGAARANNAIAREACCLLELPSEAFMEVYNGGSGATVSLQHAIHRSLMRSIARTNTQLARLISHHRLAEVSKNVADLEVMIRSQMWQPV
jgi:CRP-like cAMP-binding protein